TRWEEERVAERLWQKDGSLWAASGHAADEMAAWLGWLDLPDAMRGRINELEHLARDVRGDGYTRATVLGMGGSSLAPELFSRMVAGAGPMELRILDSTHPDAVRAFRDWAQSARTLFCVSSKSGSTTEPNAFHAAMSAFAPALDFLAITDPGSALAEVARAQEFRGIIEGPPDVGGRYSALSVFGLVPAALAGVDLNLLLDRAATMAEACRRPAQSNPGLRLGAAFGEAALAGRDKLTILTSRRLASFGDWAEQLIAESTGKQGRGIVPIVGEPVAEPERYAADRAFVVMTLDDPASPDLAELSELADLTSVLEGLGHPVVRIALSDIHEIGAEFLRWEVATAAAGIILEIDPFDQPNVQESKDATRELLDAFRRDGSLPQPPAQVEDSGLAATADAAVLGGEPSSVAGALRTLLASVRTGDYTAVLAYVPQDAETEASLGRVRRVLRDGLGVATTAGFGPRFLHSTGQLHKGGPDSGVFLQLTADPQRDLPIPGWSESFGTLIAAQALGDLRSLQSRRRRVLRLHGKDTDTLLTRVETMVADAVGAAAIGA
ncbi:MAG TPA: transaldolase, partial [Candidatus Limnocylindria bacterium]|nr:transaldolase [Candidatus Limnocylindria bacterium]